jgi:hypothetical protein
MGVRVEERAGFWGMSGNGGLDECLDERFVEGEGTLEGGWTHTAASPYCNPTGFNAHMESPFFLFPFSFFIFRQTLSNLEIINESYRYIQCYKKEVKKFLQHSSIEDNGFIIHPNRTSKQCPKDPVYWNEQTSAFNFSKFRLVSY